MFEQRPRAGAGTGLELIVLRFAEPEGASNALAALQTPTAPQRRWVEEAAVVERHGSGRVSMRGTYAGYDSGGIAESDATKAGIAVGSITGAVIGLLGGPIGIVVGLIGGGAVGGAIGFAIGGDTSEEVVFDKIKRQLPKGSSALLLLAETETADEMITTFRVGEADWIRQPLAEDEVEQLQRLILDAGGGR